MVAYWAVNRQGLQEAAATDSETNTAVSNGSAKNGDGCGGGGTDEAHGRLGVSCAEGEEGSVSQQERVFLSIVARYDPFSLNHSSFPPLSFSLPDT